MPKRSTPEPKIIGAMVSAVFPEFSEQSVLAKIDTGAYTGALHYSKLKEKPGKDGSRVLEFAPLGGTKTFTIEEFAISYVKSSNGAREKRYFVDTQIEIEGKAYSIVLSLANRGDMKFPVLIGRRFLKQNNFIVDVNHGAAAHKKKEQP